MSLESANKRIEQIVSAVVILIPFIIMPFNRFADYYYHPKVIAITIASIAFLIILLKNLKQLGKLIEGDGINITLMVYFVLLTISLFFAINIKLAIEGTDRREEGYSILIMYMLLFLAARAASNLDGRFYKGMLITACILSVYGILQYYKIDPIPQDFIRRGWYTAFSTFGNPNFTGTYLVLMIPFSMHFYIIKKSKLGCIAFSIILLCLLCTMTRGAWIGGFAAVLSYLMVMWFLREKYKGTLKRTAVLMVIAIVIIIGFNLQTGNAVRDRFKSVVSESKDIVEQNAEAEYAGSSRLFIWKRVVELIVKKPWFGFGISNLQIPLSEFYSDEIKVVFGNGAVLDKAHNEYLNIAVSSGIPSLLAYLGFLLLILKKGLSRLKKEPFLWPIMAAVLGYLMQAFFNISVVSVAYIFWVFLGLMAGEKEEIKML